MNKKKTLQILSILSVAAICIFGYKKLKNPCSPNCIAGIRRMTPTTLLKNIDTINQENIIFDLTGVLFHLGKNAITKEIGLPTVVWYSLTHWHNPLKFGEVLIDFLNYISPAANGMHYRNSPLPALVCQWLKGEKESAQIRAEIAHKIEQLDNEKYFKSTLEKEIFSQALDTVFTPKKC